MTSSEAPGGRVDSVQYAADLLVETDGSSDPAKALCALAVQTLGMSGVGLGLSRGNVLECVAVSDDLTDKIEEIEFTVGEGPCVSALRTARPTSDVDLSSDEPADWPVFRREAATAGIGAAFGFPLLSDGACFGAMNLYRREPGALTSEQHANALVVTEVSGNLVLVWQAAAGSDRLAWQLERVPEGRVQVPQAVGRIAAQADVSIADALALLRAYAFAHGRPILEVAREVAGGNLRIG